MSRSWITELVLSEPWSTRCSGKRMISFKEHVNVLVGPKGSGKSTILQILGNKDVAHQFRSSGGLIRSNGGCRTIYFDSERMNPRVAAPGKIVNVSHGQVMLPIMTKRFQATFEEVEKQGGSFVGLLDEPESGLDHDGVLAFMSVLGDVVRQGAQVMIATHHPLIWQFPDAHIIDLTWDYRERALSGYAGMGKALLT